VGLHSVRIVQKEVGVDIFLYVGRLRDEVGGRNFSLGGVERRGGGSKFFSTRG